MLVLTSLGDDGKFKKLIGMEKMETRMFVLELCGYKKSFECSNAVIMKHNSGRRVIIQEVK